MEPTAEEGEEEGEVARFRLEREKDARETARAKKIIEKIKPSRAGS